MKNSIIPIILLFIIGLWLQSSFPEVRSITNAVQSPNGRVEWRSMMRSHDLKPDKVFKARDIVREKINKGSKYEKDAGLNKWTELGPTGVGGRIRAIAIHPTNDNILFVGGVSGGIWKSTNGGSSWTPKGDLLPSLAITSILIHPTNPDTMYASTGEGILASIDKLNTQRQALPGAGIFKSTNGGNTWDLIDGIHDGNQSQFYWVNKIVWDPSDYSSFFAGTQSLDIGGAGPASTNGYLYKITNDGGLVQPVYTALGSNGITDIDIYPSGDSLYIGTSAIGGFRLKKEFTGQYSPDLDNLAQYEGIPDYSAPPKRAEVAFSKTVSNVMYMLCQSDTITFGKLYKSTDSGNTWVEKDMHLSGTNLPAEIFNTGAGTNQGWYDNTIWVDPNNSNKIIVGGINLWRSIDGGDNLIQLSDNINYDYGNGTSPHADQHIIIEASDYSTANKKIYVGNDGGIAKAANYEIATINSNWILLNNNLSITQFYNSDVRQNDHYVAGAQDNGTSLNLSGTWSELGGGDGGYCGFGKGDTVYFSLQNGQFFYSPDNGANSSIMNSLFTSEFIAPLKVFPNNRSKVLMADSLLWYSQDISSVLSWTSYSPPRAGAVGVTITAIEIDANEKVIIGYEDGEVWSGDFSNLASIGWMQKADFNRVVTDIAFNPLNSDKIAVSLGGYTDENVFISADNGTTWISRSSGIPALHINTIIWHYSEPAWLYAGSDLGIFATEDNGQNWNVSPNFGGISDGPVFTEITNLQWGNISAGTGFRPLYATTYGRGMWKTSNQVRDADLYIDEDHVGFEFGVIGAPYIDIHDAEAVKAHGQKWHIDGGTYPTSSSVIIDKRLGEIKLTGTGPVIIGQN